MRRLHLIFVLSALSVASPTTFAAASPTGFASAYLSGLIAEQRGETGIASNYFTTAWGLVPETPMLQRRVMRLQLIDGGFQEAAKAAEALADAGDDNFPIPLIRIVNCFRKGDFERALNLVKEPGFNRISSVVAILAKAWSEAGVGDIDVGVKTLTDAAKTKPDLDTLLLLHAAFLADQAGRVDVARWLYEEALAAAESKKRVISPRLIRAVSDFFERLDMSNTAAEVRAKGNSAFEPSTPENQLVTSPSDGFAEALFNFAGSLYGDRQYTQALTYARLSESLRPNDPSLRFTIAQILEASGRYSEAVKAYELVPKVGSYAWMSGVRAAESLAESGDNQTAIQAMRNLLIAEPEEPQIAIALGHMLRANNNFSEAVEAYDEARRRKGSLGEGDGWLRYARGIALDRSGRWREAEEEFLASLASLAEEPLILNYLGYSWIDRGENIERAYAMVARAVELRPNDGFIRDSLGWAEYRKGDFEKAVATLERAIEMQPVDPVINEHLGDAYWQVGRLREARFQWRRALSFEPEEKQIPIIEEKLKCGVKGCPAAAVKSDKQNGNGG